MFGYVKPYKPELKVKDYEIFKAYYCGLCRTIKESFGNIPRLCLNYDMTFMAILLDSLGEEEGTYYMSRCLIHPSKNRMILKSNKALIFSAYLNVALTYYKICDDIQDDKSLKGALSGMFLKGYKDLFSKEYKTLNTVIKDNLDLLNSYESKESIDSLDEVCHPFAYLTGKVLENYDPSMDETRKDNLFNLGYNLGKWIYLMDALDDLKEDMRKNKFNPLNAVFNKNGLSFNEFYIKIKDGVEFNILCCANNVLDYYNSLQANFNNALLHNILSLGLMHRYELVINKYTAL
ncbi:DUF5685 family protein [Clostridium polynesiense]|uniref:DUF5685 family protein n=1 Tax=Clostridium polynesiense TaxID=1325933 RepID=UPI00058D45FB|nr:DUF5685 family protein [Clostridium polynesiense]